MIKNKFLCSMFCSAALAAAPFGLNAQTLGGLDTLGGLSSGAGGLSGGAGGLDTLYGVLTQITAPLASTGDVPALLLSELTLGTLTQVTGPLSSLGGNSSPLGLAPSLLDRLLIDTLGNPRAPGIDIIDPRAVSNALSGGSPPKPGSDSLFTTLNPSIILGLTAPVFNTLEEGVSLPGSKVIDPALAQNAASGALTIGPADDLLNQLTKQLPLPSF